MRDTTVSAWLLQLIIIFILFFTAYLALSINYTRAFKIRNNVITMIEKNEGVNPGEIEGYLASVNQVVEGECSDGTRKNYCISGGGGNYEVTIFFKFSVPVLGDLFKDLFTFSVNGQTSNIHG